MRISIFASICLVSALAFGEDLVELTAEDRADIARLTAHEQAYALHVLKDGSAFTNLNCRDLKKGSLGFLDNRPIGFHIDQIVNDSEVLIYGNNIYVEGVDTSDLDEGSTIGGLGGLVFYCTGNRQYNTVLGSTRSPKHCIVANTESANDALRDLLARHQIVLVRNKGRQIVAIGKIRSLSKTRVQIQSPKGRATWHDLSEILNEDIARLPLRP